MGTAQRNGDGRNHGAMCDRWRSGVLDLSGGLWFHILTPIETVGGVLR